MFRKVYNMFRVVWMDIKESNSEIEKLFSDIDENDKI